MQHVTSESSSLEATVSAGMLENPKNVAAAPATITTTIDPQRKYTPPPSALTRKPSTSAADTISLPQLIDEECISFGDFEACLATVATPPQAPNGNLIQKWIQERRDRIIKQREAMKTARYNQMKQQQQLKA